MTFAQRVEQMFAVTGRPAPLKVEMPDIARHDRAARFIWSSCSRKIRFGSESDAAKKARQFGQNYYSCEFCNGWHCYTKAVAKTLALVLA